MQLSTGVTLENKKRTHKCAAHRCGNKAQRKGVKWHKFCSKHRAQRQKETSPARYAYDRLKVNARRRCKVFTISFEYFKTWCEETGYLLMKGRSKKAATIDRIDDSKGYEPGNLQVLTNSDNVRKRYIPFFSQGGTGWSPEMEQIEDLPF